MTKNALNPSQAASLRSKVDVPPRPPIGRYVAGGIAVIGLLFGGLGSWAALAPLTSAAIAPGVVKVDTSSKVVQHLEGGIIRDILVRDGEAVKKGQVLVRLDDADAEADLNAIHGQIGALEAEITSTREQLPSVEEQLSDQRSLYKKGFARKPVLLDLERTVTQLKGQIAANEKRLLSLREQERKAQAKTDRNGIDGAGEKHVLALALGAMENAAVVKALLADLVERGLQPDIARLFIVDGAKALSRAVRDTFGRFALIQRCQVHKGRNIIERLDPSLHAGVKKVLRQAWDSPSAEQAERVLRSLARRLDHDAPGVSASIHEGLDEMLTVIRLGLPDQLRRSLGCTNAIESMIAVLRTVCSNVKRWRNARMALRWTGTAMLEAKKGFRRLKAHKQLPVLRTALLRHQQAVLADQAIDRQSLAA